MRSCPHSHQRLTARSCGLTLRRIRSKTMGGTILCGVTDSSDGRAAAQLAVALGERLGLRLVLAHVVDVPAGSEESVTARKGQAGAERSLEAIAREIGLPGGS